MADLHQFQQVHVWTKPHLTVTTTLKDFVTTWITLTKTPCPVTTLLDQGYTVSSYSIAKLVQPPACNSTDRYYYYYRTWANCYDYLEAHDRQSLL